MTRVVEHLDTLRRLFRVVHLWRFLQQLCSGQGTLRRIQEAVVFPEPAIHRTTFCHDCRETSAGSPVNGKTPVPTGSKFSIYPVPAFTLSDSDFRGVCSVSYLIPRAPRWTRHAPSGGWRGLGPRPAQMWCIVSNKCRLPLRLERSSLAA